MAPTLAYDLIISCPVETGSRQPLAQVVAGDGPADLRL
jgi:hypothetical protein